MLLGGSGLGRGGTLGAPEPAEPGKGVRKAQRLHSVPGEVAPRPSESPNPSPWGGVVSAKENVWTCQIWQVPGM